ncbi:MAG: PilZ domain-containing protein [Nitrospirota bacterium]
MRKVKNRRKQLRHLWAGDGAVTYRRSIPTRGLGLKSLSGHGRLRDVSGGGLCLITDERLAPKQLLAISFPLPVAELAIPTLAYVQWTRPVRGTGQYAAGLAFVV